MERVPEDDLDFDEDLIFTYQGKRFTGIGYETSPDGGLSEVMYVDGMQDGVGRDLYPDGSVKYECHYKANLRHGTIREYSPDHRLTLEAVFGYDILLVKKAYDETGRLSDMFELQPGGPEYALYRRREQRLHWPSVDEAATRLARRNWRDGPS